MLGLGIGLFSEGAIAGAPTVAFSLDFSEAKNSMYVAIF